MHSDSDRGCTYCVFVDEIRCEDESQKEIQKLEAKLMENEVEIRRLQCMNGRLECMIEFKSAEIKKLSKKITKLLIYLGVSISITIMMFMSG